MSKPKLVRIRKRKMKAQNGLCYYCEQPMWMQDIKTFCTTNNLSKKQARWFKCTAEHLMARCDGGKDTDKNVVAACDYCNKNRHYADKPMSSGIYLKYVREQLRNKKWHGLVLPIIEARRPAKNHKLVLRVSARPMPTRQLNWTDDWELER